jgi:hypothetical protein
VGGGAAATDEVNKLLEMFSSHSESVENNFTLLRKRIDDLE